LHLGLQKYCALKVGIIAEADDSFLFLGMGGLGEVASLIQIVVGLINFITEFFFLPTFEVSMSTV